MEETINSDRKRKRFRLSDTTSSILLYVGISAIFLQLPMIYSFWYGIISNITNGFTLNFFKFVYEWLIPVIIPTIIIIIAIFIILLCGMNLLLNRKKGKPLGIWFGFSLNIVSLPILLVMSSINLLISINNIYIDLYILTTAHFPSIYYSFSLIIDIISSVFNIYAILSCLFSIRKVYFQASSKKIQNNIGEIKK
ncbi:MAG: hypothetical protein P8Y70_06085 [Candidatus Lokiarchaeota archaeon]